MEHYFSADECVEYLSGWQEYHQIIFLAISSAAYLKSFIVQFMQPPQELESESVRQSMTNMSSHRSGTAEAKLVQ